MQPINPNSESAATLNQSPLLRLPRELRNEIYSLLFYSTRLSFGIRKIHIGEEDQSKIINPAPHSLAILYTCQQIHTEARDLWVSRVTFSYTSPKAAVSNLSVVPADLIARIRYMRIFSQQGSYNSVKSIIRLVTLCDSRAVFDLFPELKLETITIVYDDECTESPQVPLIGFINTIVDRGYGWKNLHIIGRHSKPFCMSYNRNKMQFKNEEPGRKLEMWNRQLSQRDGASSGAQITLFYAVDSKNPDAVINMTSDKLIEHSEATNPLDMAYHNALVIIARGKDVDIQKERPKGWMPPGFMKLDSSNWSIPLRELKSSVTWKDFLDHYSQGCRDFPRIPAAEDLVDEYDDVDDFVWPHRPLEHPGSKKSVKPRRSERLASRGNSSVIS